jgi:hypothetical protein
MTAVEPGEPEWLLDVLQSLFDHFFVLPARMQRKQDALEEKLAPPVILAVVDDEADNAAVTDDAAAADPMGTPDAVATPTSGS